MDTLYAIYTLVIHHGPYVIWSGTAETSVAASSLLHLHRVMLSDQYIFSPSRQAGHLNSAFKRAMDGYRGGWRGVYWCDGHDIARGTNVLCLLTV